ncbi:hypothetical protein CXQ85_004679 [Candidozyma haemuli]|uniref:Succinate dehydrogenase [ubiquinone] cytochrome b small subunit n=1 Tax=Candidozyma haemuli TaxID=45357 RepID=A0A2V1AXD0_9ASCO|nr:hypothetical protein CXQ85_004679 [[Candida] haemuloni]PVH22013.1 hypothetical protein CXQ85_004679 [[Candida] haemuloni]
MRPLIGKNMLGLQRSATSLLMPKSLVASRCLSLKPNFSFSKLKLKKDPPGNIVGTVNDAYKFPEPDHYHGSNHWTYDRILAMGLVPLTAFPFVMGVNFPMMDTAFCLTVLLHSYAGFKSCIIDYIPERIYGFWHRAAMKLLGFGTFVSLYGIYILETTENGLFDFVSTLYGA